MQAAVAQAVEAFGGLDLVVPNAAVQLTGRDDRVDRLDLETWQRTIDVNLTGAFLTAKHGIGAMLETAARASSSSPRPPACTASRAGWTPTRRRRRASQASCACSPRTMPPRDPRR